MVRPVQLSFHVSGWTEVLHCPTPTQLPRLLPVTALPVEGYGRTRKTRVILLRNICSGLLAMGPRLEVRALERKLMVL